jgi:hypothetical protein
MVEEAALEVEGIRKTVGHIERHHECPVAPAGTTHGGRGGHGRFADAALARDQYDA